MPAQTEATEISPDHGEQAFRADMQEPFPLAGSPSFPIVGLGGSAGSLKPLQSFLRAMPADTGMAFVVILHLSPDYESTMAEILQASTRMPVIQIKMGSKVEPNHVYVIPPGKHLTLVDGHIAVSTLEREAGRHVTVDLFFRTLADFQGSQAVAVVLSGSDSDGAIGLKRVKERGGLTIAQDPQEAEYNGMPRSAIDTGMVDWILRAEEIPARIVEYWRNARDIRLPDEQEPAANGQNGPSEQERETALRKILALLHTQTGRDFSAYKRATVLRRIARRMQVNGLTELEAYHDFLRTHPGETGALLQDLLISVTNFFRDRDSFTALNGFIPGLFAGKGPKDSVRIWVAACATGEEAYSLAMMLHEYARTLLEPPAIQIFATDLDESAIAVARAGYYSETISADVSEERLQRYFVAHHGLYRVNQKLRESVLFAVHDLLKDSPFSRVDLVSCRNFLIYLNRTAQRHAFDVFHFALRPDGLLFLGSSETSDEASSLFLSVDKRNRISRWRAVSRAPLPLSASTRPLLLPEPRQPPSLTPLLPVDSTAFVRQPGSLEISPAELHFKLVEKLAPPSLVVSRDSEIIHLSPGAGRFLAFNGGAPTANLMQLVSPMLRGELRAAIFQAAQSNETVVIEGTVWESGGKSLVADISISPAPDIAPDYLLITFREKSAEAAVSGGRKPSNAEGIILNLERELDFTKQQFHRTLEQHGSMTEEMKASNEELQAMNEELRSASEELETSREELQSINEELITVNAELKSKVDELARANSDLQNLMGATSIATIFLDGQLRIKRYTPSAVSLFNIIPSDTGRPLSDLTHRLEFDSIATDAARVLSALVPIDREVHSTDDQWFLARIIPYRTAENHIAGVVLTFVDITGRKRAEESLRVSRQRMAAIFAQAAVGLCEISVEGRFVQVNDELCRMTGRSRDVLLSSTVPDITHPDDLPASREAVETVLSKGGPVTVDQSLKRPDGTLVWVNSILTRLDDEKGGPSTVLAVTVDLTNRKHAEEELRLAHESLERRVQARTKELDTVNQMLRAEINERIKAQKDRQDLLQQLVNAQETERGRISRELHDQVGQHITTLNLGLKSLAPGLNTPDGEATLKSLLDIAKILGREIHELALEIRPTALDDLGLLRTLRNFVEEWSKRAGVEARFHSEGLDDRRLPPQIESTLYRIASEALNNVRKHAGARHVSVILQRQGSQVAVIIEDDGCGFDADARAHDSDRSLGLLGMTERAMLLDGKCAIESTPGRGTTVFVHIPLPPAGPVIPPS